MSSAIAASVQVAGSAEPLTIERDSGTRTTYARDWERWERWELLGTREALLSTGTCTADQLPEGKKRVRHGWHHGSDFWWRVKKVPDGRYRLILNEPPPELTRACERLLFGHNLPAWLRDLTWTEGAIEGPRRSICVT